MGWRGVFDLPYFPPTPTHADPVKRTALPRWRTVRDVIADLPRPVGVDIGIGSPLDLHFGRNPTSVNLARYAGVPAGGNRFDLQRNRPDITPDCWVRKISGGTDLFGRLW